MHRVSRVNRHVLRAQYNMWLCGLLVTLSLVLTDVHGSNICHCEEDSTTVLETMDAETHINSGLSTIQCFVYNVNLLRCSWSTDCLPEDAQYSASFQLCDIPNGHPLNCVTESSKKLVECQSQDEIIWLEHETELSVVVNISTTGYWYTVCQNYIPTVIEKLDPPQNITTAIKSTNLEIQWRQPRSCCTRQDKCFVYELKINNELVKLESLLTYNLTNFNPKKTYTIQIRTKLENACVSNNSWSDWSKAEVVNSHGSDYHLSAAVIASIVFVLPMILLAFLLVCKFQRLFDKLFPSIPNPSKNVQMLLEKNNFNQDMPPKQSEEGAEILEVIG